MRIRVHTKAPNQFDKKRSQAATGHESGDIVIDEVRKKHGI